MNASQRLVLNTAATYGRSVFALALALFSSRWVLNALGQSDFGLFSLVGSIIIIITFLNSVMAGSVSRHLAYSIGQGDSMEVSRWFNTALSIHLCIGFGLALIGWPIGEYVIAYILNISPDRIQTCLWVYRFSLFSAFASMVSIPFVAMFTAQQHITEIAGWGTLQTILVFTLAYFLSQVTGDRLLFYAACMVAIIVFIQIMMVFRGFYVFRECRIVMKDWFDRRRFMKILSFAFWNLIGGFGVTCRNQGSAILLNLFFGAKVNAAFGIANQVSTQANQLSSAMLGAFSPEITVSEARGDRTRMLDLSHRASKIGTILILLFAVPLIAEMDYVLKIWLREPPLYTSLFCRLILCTFLIERLSNGYMMAVNAHGKVAGYQATVGASLVLTLPLAWLFLYLGYAPTSAGYAFIITMLLCTIGRMFWVHCLFGVSVSRWIGSVVLPCLIVSAAATLAALAPRWLMAPSFSRLVYVTALSIIAASLTTWFLAFDSREREFVRQNRRQFFNKISGAWSQSG
jgi:O-antigen/teichoic acid export membrane protein